MGKSFRTATLVRTLLVEPIEMPDSNPVKLRVEVFAWSSHEYTCQVFRMDTYRVRPTFFEGDDAFMADEEFMVLDVGSEHDWRNLRAATVDELLNLLFDKMELQFGWKVDRQTVAVAP